MAGVQDRVVLITGASSGIGEATARRLAQAGAKVVLGARRTERLSALVAEIEAAGGQAAFQKLDVTSLESMLAFARFAKERFGRVDVLLNNAGIMPLSPLADLKVEEWNRMIDVNIRGVLHGIAAALPIMQEQGGGHVINIASVGAHQVYPTTAVYSATKYAVWAITEGLRQESGTIRATVICPGVVESELADTISSSELKDQVDKAREVAMKPDAIARAVLYTLEQPAEVAVNELIVRPSALSAF